MSTPELLFETDAPLTGHTTTWHLEFEGRPIDVKLERGTQHITIIALDTGRTFKTTSQRGAAIVALVLEAYAAQFGDDMDVYRAEVAGDALLADYRDADRNESETAVNPALLTHVEEDTMTQHNEKSPAGATNTNEGNKSIRERSTSTAYLAYNPDNTRYTFGTWSGDDLAMKDHITIIVPMKTAHRMYADGPQLIGLNRACAEAQSAEARKQREEKAAKEREEELRRLRREIEDTTYGDEIDALENKLTEIYARVDAEAKALFRNRF